MTSNSESLGTVTNLSLKIYSLGSHNLQANAGASGFLTNMNECLNELKTTLKYYF